MTDYKQKIMALRTEMLFDDRYDRDSTEASILHFCKALSYLELAALEISLGVEHKFSADNK